MTHPMLSNKICGDFAFCIIHYSPVHIWRPISSHFGFKTCGSLNTFGLKRLLIFEIVVTQIAARFNVKSFKKFKREVNK